MWQRSPDHCSRSAVFDERGQGVIEFLLVLLLSLTVIGGVVYQFATAFGFFSEQYFGGYLTCLLETGELPTLGNENGTAAGECDAEFQPFSLSNGRPPVTSTGGPAGQRGGRPNFRGSSRGGPRLGSTRPSSNADFSGAEGAPARQGFGSSSSGGRNPIDSGESVVSGGGSEAASRPGRRSTVTSGRILQRGQNQRSANITTLKKRNGSGGESLRQKRQVQKIKKPKAQEVTIKAGWSFAKILRYLIMLFLLLGLLLIVGFQALQIKKSMEAQ